MVGNVVVSLLDPPVSVEELALRRAAVAITAQLPVDLEDALKVLDLAKSLVTDFYQEP